MLFARAPPARAPALPPLPPSLGRLSRPAVREIVHIQTGQVSGVPPSPRAAQAACWPPGGRRPRGPSGRTRSLTPAAPCFDLARLDSVETRSVPRYAPFACPPAPPPDDGTLTGLPHRPPVLGGQPSAIFASEAKGGRERERPPTLALLGAFASPAVAPCGPCMLTPCLF